MPARVTSDEVKEIIEVPSTLTLTAFITAANVLVNQNLTASGLDDDLLKEIERWLAAHFAAIRVRQLASQDIGEGKDQYQYKLDLGLRVTMYGQQAIMLDPTGILDRLTHQRKQLMFETINATLEDSGE
jgi:hypothetical protein